MKIKYPKNITIGSVGFKVIYDQKDDGGAHFSYSGDAEHPFPHIYFGVKSATSMDFLEMVIHELKEIIQIEQDVRHVKRNDGSYLFCYSHAEHTDLCARLTGMLKKFIK